jgi:hypothetical protein
MLTNNSCWTVMPNDIYGCVPDLNSGLHEGQRKDIQETLTLEASIYVPFVSSLPYNISIYINDISFTSTCILIYFNIATLIIHALREHLDTQSMYMNKNLVSL